VLEYKNGQQYDYEISPADFGITPLSAEAVSAVNAEANMDIARAMLKGLPVTEHYQLVCINAAFIYTKFVEEVSYPVAYQKMKKMLMEGVMGAVLEQYK